MTFHSILVPTYNQEKYIGAALDSIMAQTDSDWEAIVVNDGSTDSTRKLIETYSRRDPRIKCFHQENGGVGSALNLALEKSTGDWIHWLSSDDLFEPNKLAVNRRSIASHPEINFFYSYFTLLKESTGELEERDLWGPIPQKEHQILTLFFRNYISGISICVRRTAWDAVGYFDVSLRYAQDYDQWLRILQKNIGVFIPERTVVSRNHSEQGSETFPAACYFDTAKAAIRFINKHTFLELVPFANLADKKVARDAVSYCMDVASDETSFLYSLGVHTALVIRLLEWVYSDTCPCPTIRVSVEDHVRKMAFQQGDGDWSWMWRQLALALRKEHPHFTYQPVMPVEVATRTLSARADNDAASIAEYLARFEQVHVGKADFNPLKRSRIAILTDGSTQNKELLLAANQLATRGYRPIVLTEVKETRLPNWQLDGQVPVLAISGFDKDTLPWLGDVDLAVYIGAVERSTWIASMKSLDLEQDLSAELIKTHIAEALNYDEQESARKVVFLERVLKGGGAERVILDLCRHLDRKRYLPEIWTMFDEDLAISNSDIVKLRSLREVEYSREDKPSQDNIQQYISGEPSSFQLVIRLMRQVYHQLFGRSLREKIAVGAFLRTILKWIRDLRRSPQTIRTLLRKAVKRMLNLLQGSEAVGSVKEGPEITSNINENLDYVASARHHQKQALLFGKAVRDTYPNTVFVTVMEEATVAAWMAQASVQFPYISSLHTVESVCLDDIYREPARIRVEKWLFKHACKRAEAITVPSAGCSADLVENFGIDQSQIEILNNPVDCARVRIQSLEYSIDASQWKAKSKGFRLVHVARLDPQKNHTLLLEACLELKIMNRPFSLAIVGDGWARAAVEAKIAELDLTEEVFLVGNQENPFPWVAAADALTLTSQFEAFGLVLVEAMVCGTPIVSVDCPVGPHDVLGNGEFGILVRDLSPSSFANAIITLMDSPELCQHLIEKGYERAPNFDVKQIARQWEMLFDAQLADNVQIRLKVNEN